MRRMWTRWCSNAESAQLVWSHSMLWKLTSLKALLNRPNAFWSWTGVKTHLLEFKTKGLI